MIARLRLNSLAPESPQMTPDDFRLPRREWLAYAAVFGPTVMGTAAAAMTQSPPQVAGKPAHAAKRYKMKKSINLWALPYPDTMDLRQCLEVCKAAGFDAVELNYDLESDISIQANERQLQEVGKLTRDLGLEVSGLCSFLFWPYSLTSNDPQRRAKGRELLPKMIDAAHQLGTANLLVVPGAVYIPWSPEPEPVASDVCWQRATESLAAVLPQAKQAGVFLNVENIFANGFLMTPMEMNRFVDAFESDQIGVHFDTGNIMQFQFPEDWIRQLGSRINNVHLKEYSKQAGTQFSLESFRPLLDGTTDWPDVLDAFTEVGYEGYLTFEYFHPFPHYPEALVYHTSDALDRMLGRTV